jgi:hypothetical protein
MNMRYAGAIPWLFPLLTFSLNIRNDRNNEQQDRCDDSGDSIYERYRPHN